MFFFDTRFMYYSQFSVFIGKKVPTRIMTGQNLHTGCCATCVRTSFQTYSDPSVYLCLQGQLVNIKTLWEIWNLLLIQNIQGHSEIWHIWTQGFSFYSSKLTDVYCVERAGERVVGDTYSVLFRSNFKTYKLNLFWLTWWENYCNTGSPFTPYRIGLSRLQQSSLKNGIGTLNFDPITLTNELKTGYWNILGLDVTSTCPKYILRQANRWI